MTFWNQALAIARRDLLRERRSGEVLWITVPFGAVALLLIPLAIGTDLALLRDIGPGLYWVIVMLFGVLVAVRRTTMDSGGQRDLAARLGIDPAATFTGRVIASGVLLLAFEAVLGAVAVALYDLPLTGWPFLLLILPLAGAGLALLGTLAGTVVATLPSGTALVPLLVAPLAVPLLLGATQALDGLQNDRSILSWVLLMVLVVLVVAIAGVLTARPLQETQ